ncbi:hypothetical protein BKA67DRAFT_665755 [Truncatella angustata]|uniref:E3 ubiquitin-protein ligase listerin n=1 Tax=Truncatella angustata TaxID=152316 RepID=A0A9P8UV26_9PEZI|nr:uncharacterized protein BKA67DRAFT_665755 [Truncatella angustata]KAH6658918.1 hypothetical protein BKA67DRAFT_665755 [Truncatella angustata]
MKRGGFKSTAASGKAFGSVASGGFGAFSSASSGSKLSYLTEPPDLSAISDANAVVSFKNLLKKDPTTKTKALEDLLTYVEAHPHQQNGGTEDAVLEAWVQVYPRISIDNARRVRELSHTLQLELMKSARRRMERRVPKIVATWIAGTFDRDRGVSRAATEGLSSFLTTPDKTLQFWNKCQPQILEYASDAILETPDTLSDERSTSTDDAEAKYYRVLGSSLALVLNLLQKMDTVDLDKYQDTYHHFLGVDKVWTSALVNDSVVRRLASQIVATCIEKRPETIEANLGLLSKVYISEGLKSNQTGSAVEFVKTLIALTEQFPTIWTSDYRGKKAPTVRLKGFLEKGSQGSAAIFWDSLSQLLSSLPSEIVSSDHEGAIEFMKSLKSGITNREEPRNNAVNAWTCYISLGRFFVDKLTSGQVQLVQDSIFPLIEQYLFPERPEWSVGSPVPILKAYTATAASPNAEVREASTQHWSKMKDQFSSRIRDSLPEASKDFQKSQKAIADEGNRWFGLTGKILEAHAQTVNSNRPIPAKPVQQPSLSLILEAFDLLQKRNLKPFGAAATIASAFQDSKSLFQSNEASTGEVLRELEAAVSDDLPALLKSPSAPYILSCVNSLGSIAGRDKDFETIWRASIEVLVSLVDDDSSTEILQALTTLLSSPTGSKLAHKLPQVQGVVARKCIYCATSDAPAESWAVFDTAITFDVLDRETGQRLAEELTALLAKQPGSRVIKSLLLLAQKKPELLSGEQVHMSLMTSLLSLSERSDSSGVATLRSLLSQPTTGGSANFVGIISQNLNDASTSSLGVDTLIHQASQVQDGEDFATSIIPDTSVWENELLSLLDRNALDPSLSLTSSLRGAYYLIPPPQQAKETKIKRDRNGCSIPGRMAQYTIRFMQSEWKNALPVSKQAELLILTAITAEVTADQLAVLQDGSVWKTGADVPSDAENLISSSRTIFDMLTEEASSWREGAESGSPKSRLVHDIFIKLLDSTKQLTPFGLYSARVLSQLFENLSEKHGFPSSAEGWLTSLDVLKSTPMTILPAVAILSGFGATLAPLKVISNLCNRLVSDAAGATLNTDKSLATLVLLNACMPIYESGDLPVANNRLVFAVKQLTSWLEAPQDVDYRFAAETCRSLLYLLPCIKDVYGSYWERAIGFCVYIWTKNLTAEELNKWLPSIHTTLRLSTTIQSLEEPNDDLVEALSTTAEERSLALVELLKLDRDRQTQPLEMVDAIVCRQVERLPLEHIKDLSDLYSLVASDSRAIQTASFTILHNALPATQEQLAVDVLLDKKTAQLPDELLSLLLEAPTLEAYSDEALAQFPTPIRSYLLTWHLVFDAFSTASFKVRGDYADNLKNANYIGPLMNFTFDVLGHSAAHGLNLDRANFTVEQIRDYDLKLAESETEERNMQWLLIHLYYLVLKFVPGLFKSWHTDCRSKQTKIAVEDWMVKYFSPIIVSEALDDVAKWASEQEPPADDEKELAVKISRTAKEVTAGYEVDEFQASIAIKIPPAFPLESVAVVGVNRVAVNERKWQSWIMTTKGVITFSGGSLIDGLAVFKRNITGALKGQSECAICYSIISSDKTMPDKRCGTCKNLFHRTCLYKWFQSSNQNTCPLCRNPIDYLGADTKGRRKV